MAGQPRPAWFFPMARQAAPATIPTARPARPPAPAPRPDIVRPPLSQQVRPSVAPPAQPSQPQEPTPPPPSAASPQRSLVSPPAPAAAAPRSPVAPPAPAAAPPRSPIATPAPAAAAPRSPVALPAPAAAPPRSPAIPSPPTAALQRTPAATPAPKSPAASPAPAPSTSRSPAATPPLMNISPSPSKSPTIKASKSLPTSPAPEASPSTSTNALSPPIPSSPITQKQAPTSSVPTSPIPKPVTTGPHSGLVTGPVPTPASSSPELVKPLEVAPVQTHKTKAASGPPSPLTLPPPQIKTESAHETTILSNIVQKSMLVQESNGKPKMIHDNGIASSEKRELITDKGANKKLVGSEELGMKVITLAGNNRGAIMKLSPSQVNHYSENNPHSLHKIISIKDGRDGDNSSIDRSKQEIYKDKLNKAKAMQPAQVTAFMNSNVQGVNNAILYDCNCTDEDPGIYLSLSGNGHEFHHMDLQS